VAAQRCKGTRKDGRPCNAPATEGGLCYFHANPDQARILGQKGGRKNRYQVTEVVVPENVAATGLGAVLDQALRKLLAGRLDPRVASAVSQLVNTRRRLAETIDLERRVTQLEQKRLAEGSASADRGSPAADEAGLPPSMGKENPTTTAGGESGNAEP